MPIQTKVHPDAGNHVVHFYERDEDLVATVSGYLAEALNSGDAAVIVATTTHRDAVELAMAALGVDVPGARMAGRLVELDAAGTLARFMVDGKPDPGAFEVAVGGLVRDAAAGGGAVRAYGEMVALLWDAGQVTAAIELERLWNRFGEKAPLSLLCGYPSQAFSLDEQADAFADVCHLHSSVIGAGQLAHTKARQWFPGRPEALCRARSFVVETLEAWDRRDLVDDATLVTTELATNAVRHARSDFEVAITEHDGVVRVSVLDASPVLPSLPSPNAPALTAISGRGLMIVGALASRWGHDVFYDGKQVWVELTG